MGEKPKPDDDRTRIVDEETYLKFEEYRKWKDGRRAEQPTFKEKEPKPKRWRCETCGKDLGPSEWDAAKLSRMHPDGCPHCGSTKASIS